MDYLGKNLPLNPNAWVSVWHQVNTQEACRFHSQQDRKLAAEGVRVASWEHAELKSPPPSLPESCKWKLAEVFHHCIVCAGGTDDITAMTSDFVFCSHTSYVLTAGLMHSTSDEKESKKQRPQSWDWHIQSRTEQERA